LCAIRVETGGNAVTLETDSQVAIAQLSAFGLDRLPGLTPHLDRFVFDTDPRMPISYQPQDWFAFSRRQETYPLDLIQGDPYAQSADSRVTPYTPQTLFKPPRLDDSFSSLCKKRDSAVDFGRNDGSAPRLSRDIIEQILADAFYREPDSNKFPVATAGGFDGLSLYLVTDGIDGMPAGTYHTLSCPPLKRDEQATTVLSVEVLQEVSFRQSLLQGVGTFLIPILDLSQAGTKYGSRALRFGYIRAGMILDRMHLSATSLGVQFRTIGGFDDLLLARFLGIEANPNLVIPALAAVG